MYVDCTHALCDKGPDLDSIDEVGFFMECLANRGVVARCTVDGEIHYQYIPDREPHTPWSHS